MKSVRKQAGFLFFLVLATWGGGIGLSFASLESARNSAGDWKEIDHADGITVYRKEIFNSPLIAFRGVGDIAAPLSKVAAVLMDTARLKEWAPRVEAARDLRLLGQLERVEYNHTSSGFFLVRDRDFVFRASADLDKINHRMQFVFTSVEDSLAPVTDKVRGTLKLGKYTLTPTADGTATHLEVEIEADPNGAVPKWLVNLFQKSLPRETIRGIRRQVMKPDVFADAGVEEFFAHQVQGEVTPVDPGASDPSLKFVVKIAGTSQAMEIRSSYLDANGSEVARNTTSLNAGKLHSEKLEMLQAHEVGNVEIHGPTTLLTWQGPSKKLERAVPSADTLITHSMIPGYLRQHWSELQAGQMITARVVEMGLLDAPEVRFKRSPSPAAGPNEAEIEMSGPFPARFRFLARSKRLLEIRGPAQPEMKKNAGGREFVAVTKFESLENDAEIR